MVQWVGRLVCMRLQTGSHRLSVLTTEGCPVDAVNDVSLLRQMPSLSWSGVAARELSVPRTVLRAGITKRCPRTRHE